jgi:hypothetical protein
VCTLPSRILGVNTTRVNTTRVDTTREGTFDLTETWFTLVSDEKPGAPLPSDQKPDMRNLVHLSQLLARDLVHLTLLGLGLGLGLY